MSRSTRHALVLTAAVTLLASACGSEDAPSSQPSAASEADNSTASFNDADVVFAQSMIPHHAQAIEMAELALAESAGARPEIVALATAIQGAQDPEIQQMTAWLEQWGQPVEMEGMDGMEHTDGMEMDGMMTADQMAELSTLTGAAFDTAWAQMMIAHHEGAITMATEVKAAGVDAGVASLANQIIAAQQAEIDQMRALLAG